MTMTILARPVEVKSLFLNVLTGSAKILMLVAINAHRHVQRVAATRLLL
jgi:hypothetical protein